MGCDFVVVDGLFMFVEVRMMERLFVREGVSVEEVIVYGDVCVW